MNVYNHIQKIKSLKLESSKTSYVEKVNDSDLDAILFLHLDPEFQINFSTLESPNGNGVPQGVFSRIINAIQSKNLTTEQGRETLQAFCRACTETEWNYVYEPSLNGTLDLPVSYHSVSERCKLQPLNIRRRTSNFKSFDKIIKNSPFYMFPNEKGERVFTTFSDSTNPKCFDENGYRINWGGDVKNIINFQLPEPITLEMIRYGPWYIIIDIDFRSMFSDVIPFDERRNLLENMFPELIESKGFTYRLCEISNDNPEIYYDMAIQQGFSGIIIRPLSKKCNNDYLVFEKNQGIGEITSLVPGTEKYSDQIYKVKIKIGKKNLNLDIFAGFTEEDRKKMFNNKSLYIGKTLIFTGIKVGSSYLFPKFKSWKNS